MVEVLTFVFQDLVHFIGAMILLTAFFEGVSSVLRTARRRRF